jgi:hypothetical protein
LFLSRFGKGNFFLAKIAIVLLQLLNLTGFAGELLALDVVNYDVVH